MTASYREGVEIAMAERSEVAPGKKKRRQSLELTNSQWLNLSILASGLNLRSWRTLLARIADAELIVQTPQITPASVPTSTDMRTWPTSCMPPAHTVDPPAPYRPIGSGRKFTRDKDAQEFPPEEGETLDYE